MSMNEGGFCILIIIGLLGGMFFIWWYEDRIQKEFVQAITEEWNNMTADEKKASGRENRYCCCDISECVFYELGSEVAVKLQVKEVATLVVSPTKRKRK